MYITMLFVNDESFIPFLKSFILFIYSSCITTLAKPTRTILNRNDKGEYPGGVFDFNW